MRMATIKVWTLIFTILLFVVIPLIIGFAAMSADIANYLAKLVGFEYTPWWFAIIVGIILLNIYGWIYNSMKKVFKANFQRIKVKREIEEKTKDE